MLRRSGLPASLNINITLTVTGTDQPQVTDAPVAASTEIALPVVETPVASRSVRTRRPTKSLKTQMVVIDGEEMSVLEWCEYYGMRPSDYSARMSRGWTQIEALTAPLKRKPRKSASLPEAPPPPPPPVEPVRFVPRIVPIGAKRGPGRTAKLVWRNGQGRTTAEWCDHFGIPYNTYMARIRAGWTQNDAFQTPVREQPNSRR